MLDSSPSGSSERYLSIGSLNPYVHRWQIKARVVDKSPLQTTKNNSRFFHVDITDSAGDIIRAKFWSDAAEKWHGALEKGKVYCFSRGRVNVANKRFSTLNNNYELSFSADADINPADDDGSIHVQRSLCSMPLRNIFNSTRECPFPTDVLAVVIEAQPVSSVTARSSGEELKRRVLRVRDKSQMEMEISLWGEQVDCITETAALPQVYGLTGLNIRDWRGARSASSTKSTQIIKAGSGLLQPEEETAAAEMLQWYTTTGSSLSFLSMSRAGSTGEGAANDRKPVQEQSIKDIKDRNEVSPDWRYMLLASFIDSTGSLSCRCFADMGQALLGSPASEVRRWDSEKKQTFFDWHSILKSHFRVMVRAELDNYNGEQRMRYTALRVEALDAHSLAMLLHQQLKVAVPSATDFAESKKAKLQLDNHGDISEPNAKRSLVEAH
ncbi:replication factor-a c terminal domain-containing protein [Cyclospora cayetanensis]|uniref:Replication factor-a c terminal domain-containing protein n=1 Tax=Cyclospora cayetanensis TaxID=88456 RepID=A0A1D3D3T9_9EIME|nr:replication factor-a c terminal domain-containing protein [Cyclospora cayetanensis]